MQQHNSLRHPRALTHKHDNSRPDLIDSALLRPGRLDKSLLCNMPDASEREDILRAVSHKVALAASVDLSAMAHETEGFSGADLQALVYNAHLEVVHASIAAATVGKGKDAEGKEAASSDNNGEDKIHFTIIGQDGSGGAVVSKAESAALRKRVRLDSYHT
jgi:peroxin-1